MQRVGEVLLSKRIRYSPEVSDVSESEGEASVVYGEKSENVGSHKEFTSLLDVMTSVRKRRCNGNKKVAEQPKIAMNPPRSNDQMQNLTKMRLVGFIQIIGKKFCSRHSLLKLVETEVVRF